MQKFKIKSVSAREILDSRANPALCVRVELAEGAQATAGVPSGASTGEHEAYELRDNDSSRYNGMGVLKAVDNVNKKIARKLKGMDARDQVKIDQFLISLDGTANKKNLGANAILGASLATCRATSHAANKPLYHYLAKTFQFGTTSFSLPIPMFNIFNGGKHADTNLDFQEFLVIPISYRAGKNKTAEMVRMGAEIFYSLGKVLRQNNFDTDVGNEGGYAPDIYSSIQALDMIMAAIIRAGYKPGVNVGIGIDVGSSVLYNRNNKKYIFRLDNAAFTNTTLASLYHEWRKEYPIISIEDGLAENDWAGWREMTELLGDDIMLVGDDLFTTNTKRLQRGIKEGVANTILIKPNQIGTLTETIECIKLAQKNGYQVIVSHRSGETNDHFIVDLAVAAQADYLKAGAPNRGERVAKYNRLMAIAEEIK